MRHSQRETEDTMHQEEHLAIKKADVIDVLRVLETLISSLDRLGSCHAKLDKETYQRLITEFLDQWSICRRLIEARRILSEYFPTDLGDDDMDELERALHNTPHWQWECRKPPKGYRQNLRIG